MIGTILLEFNCRQLLSVGPQHSKWRLFIIIFPWNYDAVEILTNLNAAQSVKKADYFFDPFPFPLNSRQVSNGKTMFVCLLLFFIYSNL